MIERITNHASSALLKLIAVFWGKPRIGSLLVGAAEEIQAAEDAVFDVIELRDLDVADDERLRILGRIVGQRRLSTFTTEDFRTAIRARILANKSSGSRPSLVALLQLMLQGGAYESRTIAAGERQVKLIDVVDPPRQALRNILPLAKGAGKRLTLFTASELDADMAFWGTTDWQPVGGSDSPAWSVYDIGA